MLPDVAEVLGNYFADCRRQYLSVFPADEWGAGKCEANAAVLFARVRACLKIGVLPDDADDDPDADPDPDPNSQDPDAP